MQENMSDKKVRKITDRNLFNSIFNNLFLGRNVFLKTDHTTIPVRFLNYEGGVAALKIPDSPAISENCILFVERKKDIVFSHIHMKTEPEKSTYSFDVIDIQVIEHIRTEESPAPVNEIRSSQRSSQIFLSNIISDFSLTECLRNNSRRVDYLREEILKKLRNVYQYSTVSFIHDKKPNTRMDFFQTERHPYFFPELRKSGDLHNNKDLFHFMSNIYPKDFSLTDNKLTSEICVPVLYKLMLPFGYIQINSPNPLEENDYSAIRKLGMSASVLFSNDPVIVKSADDIISIADMSKTGLGIIFKDKPLIKHFRDNSTILFNICFPDNKKASVLASVRHITLIENKIYRVGAEILNIDPIGEVYYSDYIESIQKG